MYLFVSLCVFTYLSRIIFLFIYLFNNFLHFINFSIGGFFEIK